MPENGWPNEEDNAEDVRLVHLLKGVLDQMDPVPPEVVAAARGSLAWRNVDAELAELAYDSALDEDRLATVRGAEGPRVLTFEAAGLTVDVEVTTTGEERRLIGHLIPGQRAAMVIEHRGARIEVEADDRGRFFAEGVAGGPVRLLCRLSREPGSTAVETDWVSL